MATIVSEALGREWLARPEGEARFGRQCLLGDVGIPFDREIVNYRLRALGDLKCDVNLGLTIDHVGIDFDILVTAILVKSGDTGHALTEQLVAKLASRDQQSVWLHDNLLREIVVVDMLITAESDSFDFMTRSSIHVVNKVYARALALEIRGYLGIEVALALKKIDQISAAFFHEIGINCALGKYGDEFLHLLPAKKWKP